MDAYIFAQGCYRAGQLEEELLATRLEADELAKENLRALGAIHLLSEEVRQLRVERDPDHSEAPSEKGCFPLPEGGRGFLASNSAATPKWEYYSRGLAEDPRSELRSFPRGRVRAGEARVGPSRLCVPEGFLFGVTAGGERGSGHVG